MPAYFASTVKDFLHSDTDSVVGVLAQANSLAGFSSLEADQIDAWRDELQVLQAALKEAWSKLPSAEKWGVLLEYPIPRRGKRIDCVILAKDVVLVLEFKRTISELADAVTQIEDYILDLADFHQPTHRRTVVPIVVAVNDSNSDAHEFWDGDDVIFADRHTLTEALLQAFGRNTNPSSSELDLKGWNHGVYRPVPSILDAAIALYSGMSVREITHSHAGLHNLTQTAELVMRVVNEARRNQQKVICFVTGVPGAGKTLAGLNVVHCDQMRSEGQTAPAFLSGNGPLIEILREALALDCAERTTKTKKEARREVRTFIQNVHHFVEDNLDRPDSQRSFEHLIVFDEAQRAWSAEKNAKTYRERNSSWHVSEPEMILRIMDRHADWAAIVALIGGGQEIHDGEAGLAEWGRALAGYEHWKVFASPEAINGGDSVAGSVLFSRENSRTVQCDPLLHLAISVRAKRAETMALWVNRVLAGNNKEARRLAAQFDSFPIFVSRDLDLTRNWLKKQARGTRRCGLVASSGAARLRAFGLETSQAIREAYSYPHWFLYPAQDVRSSYQLETVATEFEIQGLELDYVGLCWGGDLTWRPEQQTWDCVEFRGKAWVAVRNEIRRSRIYNRYRVLLTRARSGLIIWVPRGDSSDATRDVQQMDETAEYLLSCGVKTLNVSLQSEAATA
jgi:schlafen family protein